MVHKKRQLFYLALFMMFLVGCSTQQPYGISTEEYMTYDPFVECDDSGKITLYDTSYNQLATYYCHNDEVIYKEYFSYVTTGDERTTIVYDNYSKTSLFGTIHPSSRYSSYTTYKNDYVVESSQYRLGLFMNQFKSIERRRILEDNGETLHYYEYGNGDSYVIDFNLDFDDDFMIDTRYSVHYYTDFYDVQESYLLTTTIYLDERPIVHSHYYAADEFDDEITMSELNQFAMSNTPYNTLLYYYYEDTPLVEQIVSEGELNNTIDYEISQSGNLYYVFQSMTQEDPLNADYYLSNVNDLPLSRDVLTDTFLLCLLLSLFSMLFFYRTSLLMKQDESNQMVYHKMVKPLFVSAISLVLFSGLTITFVITDQIGFDFMIILIVLYAVMVAAVKIIMQYIPTVERTDDGLMLHRFLHSDITIHSDEITTIRWSHMIGGFQIKIGYRSHYIIPMITNVHLLMEYFRRILSEEDYAKLVKQYQSYLKWFFMIKLDRSRLHSGE